MGLRIFSSCTAGPITLNWLKCLLYSRLSPFWRMSEQIRPSLGFVALPSRRKGAQCPSLSLALFSFSIRHSPSSSFSADQTDPFHRCKLTDRPPLALSMGPPPSPPLFSILRLLVLFALLRLRRPFSSPLTMAVAVLLS